MRGLGREIPAKETHSWEVPLPPSRTFSWPSVPLFPEGREAGFHKLI